jgi:hypothetical protein
MNYKEIAYLKSYPPESLYDFGLPFSEKLAENIDDLTTRVQKGKASLIIIDGGVGEGKTTLAVQIGDYAQRKNLQLDKQLSMGGSEFMKKAEACFKNDLHILIYDEAGDFNKRGALKNFNAMINRFFETYRAYKILVIICVPDFNVLDNQLYGNKIPRLLLHLYNRGENTGNFRGYSLYRMFWLKDKMKKGVVPSGAFQRTEPNFYGHNKNLPAFRASELAKISTASKLETLQKSRQQMDDLVSVKDIMKKTGKSESWVTHKLRSAGINPVEVSGRRFLYNKSIVELIRKVKVDWHG